MASHPQHEESTISEQEVRRVAQLSRLNLTDEEVAYHTLQLGSILDYVDKLKELDVEGVEPLAHPLPLTNVMREDTEKPGMAVERALANAPETDEDVFFKVTKVLDSTS